MKKENFDKYKDKGHTNAILSIHDVVILVREGGKNDGNGILAYFMSIFPRHHVLPHSQILFLSEAVESSFWRL